MFEIEEVRSNSAKIKIIGVGGAGGNAVNNMVSANLKGIEFIAVNTDAQILSGSLAHTTLQIGNAVTRGLGAGSDPAKGREAAIENRENIADCIRGADMVFITAGMGGGTGTGAAPVIAEVAKELGILTVAVVTKPFFYEGRKRAMNAEQGIKALRNIVDTIIVVPNDRISLVVEKGTPLLKSFSVANDILRQAIQGISDLILTPGLINLDFADVQAIMTRSGRAVMGSGMGKGEKGSLEAAKKAISNQLLEESSIDGARGILINITGGLELSLTAIEEATSLIYESAHEDANIIFGAVIDPDLQDEIRVTVIATGFEEKVEKAEKASLPAAEVKKPSAGSIQSETADSGVPKSEAPAPVSPIRRAEPHVLPCIEVAKALPEVPAAYKGSGRVLSKSLIDELAHESIVSEIMNYDDVLDTPTFLRKANDTRS